MTQIFDFLARHWILTSALITVIALFILNEIYTRFRGGKRVNPAQAVRLINDEEPFILDIRSAADFKKGRILGAKNIPLARLGDSMDQLPKEKDKAILVTCMLGSTSSQACERLQKAGYTAVYSLTGGINGWQGASMPLTKK